MNRNLQQDKAKESKKCFNRFGEKDERNTSKTKRRFR